MTTRSEEHSLHMAYKSDDGFGIAHLAEARFTFNYLGELVSFEILDDVTGQMKFVTLEHGEHYHSEKAEEHLFLPVFVKIEEDFIKWQTADGQSGSVESEDGDNQQEFDEVYEALQINFAYLRERSLRKQPVVVYPHGIPTDAYLDAIDVFFKEPFEAADYLDKRLKRKTIRR